VSTDKTTVLVIEDEAPIRCFLRAYLESQNFRLVEAESGEEGIGLAASHQPALILLDLGLPGMDGLDVIRRIRQWTATPILGVTVVVILLSTSLASVGAFYMELRSKRADRKNGSEGTVE